MNKKAKELCTLCHINFTSIFNHPNDCMRTKKILNQKHLKTFDPA